MPRRSANRGSIVALEGPSGAGKTTTVHEVARHLRAHAIPEAFARLSPPPSLTFRTRRELLELERLLVGEELRRFAEAVELRRLGRLVLLDTGTIGPLTYSWGLRSLAGSRWDVVVPIRESIAQSLRNGVWGIPDLTLYLDLPPGEAAERARGSPSTHPEELVDRHRRVATWERQLWVRRFPDLLPSRFECVGGGGPPGRIATAVASRLSGKLPRFPASPREAAVLLRGFRASPTRRSPRHHPGNR